MASTRSRGGRDRARHRRRGRLAELAGSQRQDEARRYAAAEALLRQDKPGEAAAAFRALAENADSGYRVVARLRAAQAEAAAGESAAAEQTLDQLAGSDGAKPVYSGSAIS